MLAAALTDALFLSRPQFVPDSLLERAGFEPSAPGESGFDFAREVRGRTESKKAIRRASVARQSPRTQPGRHEGRAPRLPVESDVFLRQLLIMLLTIVVHPFTCGRQQYATRL